MKTFALILKFFGSTLIISSVIGVIAGQFGWVATIEGEALPLIKDFTDFAVLFSFGAITYGLGFVIEKRSGPEVISPAPVLDPGNLGFVYEVMRKNRTSTVVMTVIFSLCGIGVLVGALLTPDPKNNLGSLFGLLGISVVFLGLGFLGFYRYSKVKNIKNSDAYRTIIYYPETVTELIITTFRHSLAPGKLGQRINVGIMQGKKGVATLMINEHNLDLLRQHIVSKNPGLKITTAHQSAG